MSAWYELLIQGSEHDLEVLLKSFSEDVIPGSELRLEEQSLTDRVLGLLHARTHHLVFAPASQARELSRAVREHTDLLLEEIREVQTGRFGFRAEAYSEEMAQAIRDALHSNIPAGVEVVDSEKEEVDPKAKGVEFFAPAHEYTYRCRGTIVGPPPGIIEMHQRVSRIDFVHEEPLELAYREVSAVELEQGG